MSRLHAPRVFNHSQWKELYELILPYARKKCHKICKKASGLCATCLAYELIEHNYKVYTGDSDYQQDDRIREADLVDTYGQRFTNAVKKAHSRIVRRMYRTLRIIDRFPQLKEKALLIYEHIRVS